MDTRSFILAGLCALAVALLAPAVGAADSPFNSTQGAFDALSADGHEAHVAFSAKSDALFQQTHGLSGSAQGMMNFQPDNDPGQPAVGNVPVSCLNVVGNEAFMTGTSATPISTNGFTGSPYFAPPNEWIVGATLTVFDNGDAPATVVWGIFVNPDPNHVISTPRCFGAGLDLPAFRRTIDGGHVNVTSASP